MEIRQKIGNWFLILNDISNDLLTYYKDNFLEGLLNTDQENIGLHAFDETFLNNFDN